jgi:hypothetical protein
MCLLYEFDSKKSRREHAFILLAALITIDVLVIAKF